MRIGFLLVEKSNETKILFQFVNLWGRQIAQSKKYPTRIEVKHDNKIGWIVIDQIRTIDRQRIAKILGRLTLPEIKEVKSVLKETLVD